MKQIKKYTIVFILFTIVMISIMIYFYMRFKRIELLNNSKDLLSDLYSLNNGEYIIKDGYLYKDDKKITNKYYLDGNGRVLIDKYSNIKFYINTNNKCIYKSSLGRIKLLNNNCSGYKDIKVTYNKNNSVISFSSSIKNLEYKISNKNNFKGEWIKQDYKDNLVLRYYKDGDNYIWFKDEDGNISDVMKFNIDCLSTNTTKFDPNVFYCTGSTVVLDDYDWIVVEDTNEKIELMKKTPISEKLSQCLNVVDNNYCFYTKEANNTHRWSNSYINYYLNSSFYDKLSDDTKSIIIDFNICDDVNNFSCDNESCNGYTKEEIAYNNWKCNKYTKSKIKIISYFEFNTLYDKSSNKKILNGNYWAINSYEKDKGSSIQSNGEIYILEDLTRKMDVHPVISIIK